MTKQEALRAEFDTLTPATPQTPSFAGTVPRSDSLPGRDPYQTSPYPNATGVAAERQIYSNSGVSIQRFQAPPPVTSGQNNTSPLPIGQNTSSGGTSPSLSGAWLLVGNALAVPGLLGSTNAVPLSLITKGIAAMTFDIGQNVSVGLASTTIAGTGYRFAVSEPVLGNALALAGSSSAATLDLYTGITLRGSLSVSSAGVKLSTPLGGGGIQFTTGGTAAGVIDSLQNWAINSASTVVAGTTYRASITDSGGLNLAIVGSSLLAGIALYTAGSPATLLGILSVVSSGNTGVNLSATGTNSVFLSTNSVVAVKVDSSQNSIFTGSVLPKVTVTPSLGSTSFRWLKLWVQDIDASGTTAMVTATATSLNVASSAIVLNGTSLAVGGTTITVSGGAISGASSITATTFVNAASYKVGGTAGFSGTSTPATGTVTSVNGLVTAMT